MYLRCMAKDKEIKKVGRPRAGKVPKKSYNVYLEPEIKEAIVNADGSLTASLEKRYKNIQRKTK